MVRTEGLYGLFPQKFTGISFIQSPKEETMRIKMILLLLLMPLLSLVSSGTAFANSGYRAAFTTNYQAAYQAKHPGQSLTIAVCNLCHDPALGPPDLNPYGSAYLNSGFVFSAIEALDSDGDGFSNLTEIMASPETFPGDAASRPVVVADTVKPLVTVFTIPAAASSLVVPITTLTATDAVGVTGYMVTESATAPLAGAAGWTATKPANYTFASAGAKTLYGWAKDAAGNVSLSLSAPVTITIVVPDTTKPLVTAFTIPATASSLVVPITALTATDTVGVTGYMVTESATAPLAGAAGWTATKPANYTFASAGAKTLYGWAKDAAGNVSLSLNAPVTITIIVQTDTVKPLVTAFTIPAAASSLVVPITTLTATDAVGVTGYMVTESATAPLAGAAGWTATVPANYTFASAGAKTLYGWAKDAAGNISLSKSAKVTITLSSAGKENDDNDETARVDSEKPRVTRFEVVFDKETPRRAKITVFTATDNVKVTGYKVTASAVAPKATATGWTATKPSAYTFGTADVKTLYAWAKDAAGNVSSSRAAQVVVALTASQESKAAASVTGSSIPLPLGGEKMEFSYAPVENPVISSDPAKAMPIGVSAGANGDAPANLKVSFAPFAGPVDVYLYLILSMPSGKMEHQAAEAYTLNGSTNEFELISGNAAPWKSGVNNLNENVWKNPPVSEFAPGQYKVIVSVTPAGQQDSYYRWSTSFTIK